MKNMAYLTKMLTEQGRELSKVTAVEFDWVVQEWASAHKLALPDVTVGVALFQTDPNPLLLVTVQMDYRETPDGFEAVCARLDVEDETFSNYNPAGDDAVEYRNDPPDLNGKFIKAIEMVVDGFTDKIGLGGSVTWGDGLGSDELVRKKPILTFAIPYKFGLFEPEGVH